MRNKPVVYFDVSIDRNSPQRLLFLLFTDVAPITAENFRALCTGEMGFSRKTGKPLHYKGTFFHRILKRNRLQGGDFLRQDGNYGESIYDGKFPDENPKLKHDGPGLLSMSIADRDERGSLFSVTFKANRHLDRKCVVFGKVIDGYEVLKKIENAGDEDGKPAVIVKIINCGELTDALADKDKVYKLKTEMVTDTKDESNHEPKRERTHTRSSQKCRKRRRCCTSESDTSTDSDTESSESDTSSGDTSSSSEDRHKKRKKRSKNYRHRHGKKKDIRRDKRHKRRDRKSKRKLQSVGKFCGAGISDSESGSSSGSEDDVSFRGLNGEPKIYVEQGTSIVNHKVETADMSEREEGELPKETGAHLSNGNGMEFNGREFKSDKSPRTIPDVPNHLHIKSSRSQSLSARRAMSKRMSISPSNGGRSPGAGPNHYTSRKPSVSRSPLPIPERSRSTSAARSGSSPSPVISLRRSKRRSISKSPTVSPPRRTVVAAIPIPSSVRSPSRTNRRNCSRSPLSARRRSSSRSPVEGTPKRNRQGMGLKDKDSNDRRYRSRSPDRSPARPYHYGARNERGRYSSYRRSPRRNRSPHRGRTPSGRRSRGRSRSVSRSPVRVRHFRSPVRTQSPVTRAFERPKSPSLPRTRTRSVSARDSRSPNNAVTDKSKRSPSGSPPRIGAQVSYVNGSRSVSAPSRDSRSPKNVVNNKSRRSPSGRPPRKAALVSFGNGSPDSGCD